MKHHWQQQYMAAALRASEEMWERASSVTSPTSTSAGMGGLPYAQPHPYPAFSMYGYSRPGQSTAMPWMYPSPTSTDLSQQPRSGEAMYSYGKGTHSDFGGVFGPPAVTPSMPHSIDQSHGRYRGSREEMKTTSSSSIGEQEIVPAPTIDKGVTASHSRVTSGDCGDMTSTPRKERRPSSQLIN